MIFCLLLLFASSILTGENIETAKNNIALEPASVNLSPGPEYGINTRIFQGIPGIERSRGGRLWAAWYGGGDTEGPDNYVMLVTSGDDGKTWSDLKLVIDPEGQVRAFDPCLWIDPEGKLWLFWAQAHYFWDGRGGVWAITTSQADRENPSWSQPRRLSHGVMMNKPTALKDGTWLLPAASWNIPVKGGGPEFEFDMGNLIGTNVVASTDQGKNWSMLGQARIPGVACDEHIIVERKDDSLWMLARTDYGIGESISLDKGKTWSPGKPSWLRHIAKARFCIRRLASGNLIFINHNSADGKTRSHLTAFLSRDDGKTWEGGLLLDERKGVSYPDITQDRNGNIYCVYDYSRQDKMEISMAVFSESDIMNGSDKPEFRSRILVNKATGKRTGK